MLPRIVIALVLALASGCKYEFVEGPHEAADEADSGEASGSEADSSEADTDRDEAGTSETQGPSETGESECGNGSVQPGEECDDLDFSGRDCTTLGFRSGQLVCTEECKLDTSMCK